MTTTGGVKGPVALARQIWAEGREAIRARHEAGGPGRTSVQELSNLLDAVVLELHRAAVSDLGASLDDAVTLVMHGGCGRQEFAPYSDVDLMLLYQGDGGGKLQEYAQRLIRDINDVGLIVGSSLRTPREACSLAIHDPQIFSSLTESRFLGGNIDQFGHYLGRLQRVAQSHFSTVVRGIIEARRRERTAYGETVFLLRPNIKRSPGTLRDIHLIRWLGFVRFGETEIEQLVRQRALTGSDSQQLHAANEFLQKLRCEMHFFARRIQDGLGRNEQVRLAERLGFQGADGFLPVEAMMRDYFRLTSQVRYLAGKFADATVNRATFTQAMLAPLMTRQLEGIFRMGPTRIGIDPQKTAEVRRDVPAILRLIQLSVQHSKTIEQEAWLAIRESMLAEDSIPFTPEIAAAFLGLLSDTPRLGEVLRMLHEMHVLEKIIPDFAHARGLLQFNEYHHFTVDEHTLRAVTICAQFATDDGVRGRAWRGIGQPHLLLLALLLHDLGKGFAEEHCEVGRRIAIRIGERFGLSAEDSETVQFLVHNHLMMSHLAFHRDTGNELTVAEFAANVGSAELLAMLYLLTWADISAVGPEVMTPWKDELLTRLYRNARDQLTGQALNEMASRRSNAVVDQIAEAGASDGEQQAWLRETARNLPWNYSSLHDPAELAEKLLRLRAAGPDDVFTFINPVANKGTHELCIAKRDRIRSGIFFKITGMLASHGLRVHAAEIKPLGSSLLWYWFLFEDGDFRDSPAQRLEDIRQQAQAIANGALIDPPHFRSTLQDELSPAARLSLPPIDVEIDNQTVEDATIIDVFARNRLGLLYTISRRIYLLDLDVRFARISTWGHQVLDVFYVTDSEGKKIVDRLRLNEIRKNLLAEIRTFLGEAEATAAGSGLLP